MKLKATALLATIMFGAAAVFSFVSFSTNQTVKASSGVFEQTKDTKLTAQELTGTYGFDLAHSNVGFRIKHMGLAEVPGYFSDYTGTINYDANDVTKSSVQFTAKVTSINTGIEARDKHLRNADFFEVEKYPEMSFKSTKIEKRGENQFVATGDFTLKGVTKQISLPFTINGFLKDPRSGAVKIGVSSLSSINRRDYGITYGNTLPNGVAALSDEVSINLQLEAAKATQPAAK
jgi:polyisoprenoid-binding protein YceI